MGQVDASDVEVAAAVVQAAPVRRSRFSFSHRNGIDAKGRVVLPASYRPAFAEGGMATIWRGPALAAMTLADWDAYVDGIAASLAVSGEPDPGAVLDVLWQHSFEVKLDLQGRISLPDALRVRAGLGDEVLFVGCGDRVELRPAAQGPDEMAATEDHLATLAMLQSAHGLPSVGS